MSMTDRQSGDVVDVVAPAGGTVAGKLFAFGATGLPLLPITTTPAGEMVSCYTRQTCVAPNAAAVAITAGDELAVDVDGKVSAGTGGLIALEDAAATIDVPVMCLMTGAVPAGP
jgi:predicted RecA/RadA family phage recombinase